MFIYRSHIGQWLFNPLCCVVSEWSWNGVLLGQVPSLAYVETRSSVYFTTLTELGASALDFLTPLAFKLQTISKWLQPLNRQHFLCLMPFIKLTSWVCWLLCNSELSWLILFLILWLFYCLLILILAAWPCKTLPALDFSLDIVLYLFASFVAYLACLPTSCICTVSLKLDCRLYLTTGTLELKFMCS